MPAAGGAYRAWQHDIASREDKRKKEREEAEIAATRIASTTLTMGVKVGEGGKLYGSITSKDIADALARRGITVDRHKIDLEEPLKTLGTYKVAIKVFSGMTPEVTIIVEPKGYGPSQSRPDADPVRVVDRLEQRTRAEVGRRPVRGIRARRRRQHVRSAVEAHLLDRGLRPVAVHRVDGRRARLRVVPEVRHVRPERRDAQASGEVHRRIDEVVRDEDGPFRRVGPRSSGRRALGQAHDHGRMDRVVDRDERRGQRRRRSARPRSPDVASGRSATRPGWLPRST